MLSSKMSAADEEAVLEEFAAMEAAQLGTKVSKGHIVTFELFCSALTRNYPCLAPRCSTQSFAHAREDVRRCSSGGDAHRYRIRQGGTAGLKRLSYQIFLVGHVDRVCCNCFSFPHYRSGCSGKRE